MKSIIHRILIILHFTLLPDSVMAQNDTAYIGKIDVFEMIELDKVGTEKSKNNTNFEHWMYGQKNML